MMVIYSTLAGCGAAPRARSAAAARSVHLINVGSLFGLGVRSRLYRCAAQIGQPDPAFRLGIEAGNGHVGRPEPTLGVLLEIIDAVDAGKILQTGDMRAQLLGRGAGPELVQSVDDDERRVPGGGRVVVGLHAALGEGGV